MCPDLPGHIVTAMVRQQAPAHRAGGRRRPCRPGVSRYRISQLICGRASRTGSGSREPVCPACRALAQRFRVNRDTLARPPARAASWPTPRRMRRAKLVHSGAVGFTDGAGQRAAGGRWYGSGGGGVPCGGARARRVRSVVGGGHHRAESAGAQQLAVGLPRAAQVGLRRGHSGWPPRALHLSVAGRPGLSCARRPPRALRPPGRSAKRAESSLTFRVVIKSHRTQASRTMNAETAQAVTNRVH